MPVSGNEEMVKPSFGQFSEYTAGIPIKKRRFPFILSACQPTEDSSSLPSDNELKKKGFSNPLPVSTVSDDGASTNTSGVVSSSETSVINADTVAVAASLNAGRVAASSNASGAAISSASGSVSASSNALGVAMSSAAGSVAASSNALGVVMSPGAGSVAASSNASGVAMSSTSMSVAASLNAGGIAASSNASSAAMSSASCSVSASSNASGVAMSPASGSASASSNALGVATSPAAGSVAASSNASGVAMSYTSTSVAACLNAGSVAATSYSSGSIAAGLNASVASSSSAASVASSSCAASVASSSCAASVATSSISVAGSLNAGSVVESSIASGAAMSSAISFIADPIVSSTVEGFNANSVAGSVSASVSRFSDANEKIVLEKEKVSSDSVMQGNSSLLRVKREEQSFPVQSRSLADINSKGKLAASGASDNIFKKLRKSELDLVGKESLTFSIGKDVHNQTNVDGKFGSQLPTVSVNPGLSLGSLSSMASGNNEQGFQNQGTVEPVSLNLSLSKGDLSTQLKSTEVQPDNTEGANLVADRTNWDLNTPMDFWEGPAGDDGASKMATHMDVAADIKLAICSAGTTPASIPAQQQILEEFERSAKTKKSSILTSQHNSAEDSLRLGLTTPYLHLNPCEKPSSSSGKDFSGKVVANINSPGESVPGSKPSMSNYKPIKSEPLDESVRTNSAGFKAKPVFLLNSTQVKSEIIEKSEAESLKSSTPNTLSSVDTRSLKPEPVCESNKETPERMEGPDQSDQQMLAVPTTDSSLHGGVTTHAEDSMQDKETMPTVESQVTSNMISSAGHDVNESKIAGEVDNTTSPSKKVEDPDPCTLKSMDVELPDSKGLVEGSVSDEEKINLSGDVLEEDSYGSDYESDDKRELATAMDIDHDRKAEDDFEDGEVREPVENTEIEVPICERGEAGNGNNTTDTGFKDIVGVVGDNNPSSSSFREKEIQREDPAITRSDDTNECTNTSVNKDSVAGADKEVCLQETSAVGNLSNQFDEKGLIEAIPRTSLDLSEKKDTVEGKEKELVSIRTSDMSQGTPETIGQVAEDATVRTDSEGKNNSVLPKAEEFSNDDAGKDVDNGGSRSRIINLSRASNPSSPGRTRSISGRTLQSQVGRERLPDVALEGDNFHPRGRDEDYADSSHRFSRERRHLQQSRNNRISFMRGRGRISSRIDILRGNQDSECNFGSEFYNGPTEFRVARHKYAPTVSDADLNFSSYNNGQGGAYFGTGRGGTGRGGRKILNDDPSVFPEIHPRRRSPGGRDGPAGRGIQMVRRVPRNLSPSRCIGEDGSEVVGLRNMRGFANEHTDPMFSRCQPSFEGLDGPFVRGDREFASVQRRGVPRTRSKSPTRQRTRSPGPWSSLRRRSPGGPMELPHRRSPPVYRVERIRSPDRPCFDGEMGIRRHGSPPYMSRASNDLRDLDPGRDHGHPRSGISNRNQAGRILLRNNRRLDLVDPRERNEGDEYFGGPMPSGRFHELGTDGNTDERRRYGDRRGPVRPFRPPYSVADNENFQLNAEGGPRPFRFCPEDDQEMHGRGNMREREFDRRIKNRPGNAPPRRTRNIEDQEGNFRHGGQVWHDDGFEDTSQQVKRKRF